MSPGREERPGGDTEAFQKARRAGDDFTAESTVERRRSRRAARQRLNLLNDLHGWPAEPARPAPQHHGRNRAQQLAYAAVLRAQGWQDWELRERLTDPRQVAA